METITKTDIEEVIKAENTKALILYDDPVNTFEHVIDCLIKYCKCETEQAGQITFLVHHKGKCDIKHGSFDDLLPIYNALLDNKLNCKIE